MKQFHILKGQRAKAGQQAGEGLVQVVEQLVNHAVRADLDAQLLGELPRAVLGDHVEADNEGPGGPRQLHVRLAHGADAGVEDVEAHLLRREIAEGLAEHLDRTLHVGLYDHVQLGDARLGLPAYERFEGAWFGRDFGRDFVISVPSVLAGEKPEMKPGSRCFVIPINWRSHSAKLIVSLT